jgi:hypothetical protein
VVVSLELPARSFGGQSLLVDDEHIAQGLRMARRVGLASAAKVRSSSLVLNLALSVCT